MSIYKRNSITCSTYIDQCYMYPRQACHSSHEPPCNQAHRSPCDIYIFSNISIISYLLVVFHLVLSILFVQLHAGNHALQRIALVGKHGEETKLGFPMSVTSKFCFEDVFIP